MLNTEIRDRGLALQAMASRAGVYPLGGHYGFRQTAAAFEEVAASERCAINGSNVGSLTVRLECTARVDGGSGMVRLYNVTDAVAVTGSEITVSTTTPQRLTVNRLTLSAGPKVYRADAQKGTTWIDVWGAKLIVS